MKTSQNHVKTRDFSSVTVGTFRTSDRPVVSLYAFICPKLPFVGCLRPLIFPFVWKNKPFVGSTRGFTLIELIVALLVVAVLATIALPGMRDFILEQRLRTQVNDFVSDLNFARSEAIKRRSRIGVCPGTSAGCSGTNWNNGRVVFLDANNDATWSAGDQVLRFREELVSNTLNPNGVSRIIFDSMGAVSVGAGTFTFCDPVRGSDAGRSVVLTSTGLMRTCRPGDPSPSCPNPITC